MNIYVMKRGRISIFHRRVVTCLPVRQAPACRTATGRCLIDRKVVYEAKNWNAPPSFGV